MDAVVEGKKAFATFGCTVCHATDKNDNSIKTGPNLYGLFLNEARERQVMNPADKKVVGVRADKKYFDSSVRKSWDVLAVAERGPTRGTAYAAIMPMYSADVIPDQAVEQIWHYLRTRADAGQAGPAMVKMTVKAGAKPKNLLAVANEVVVTKRPRVFRAPVRGSSGRALHVGLPNGMNYTFDPRMLSVRNIWGGGFLNLSEERRGRGKPGSKLGQGARVFLNKGPILQPLTSSGEPVDFEFKEPDVLDHKAIEKYVWDDRDFMQYLSGMDAEFLGHRLDGETGDPSFQFRVGSNRLSQQVKMTDDGGIEIELTGMFKADQAFKVGNHGLADITVSAGQIREGAWTLTGRGRTTARLKARLAGAGLVARPTLETAESFAPQPLVTAPARSGRQPLDVPAGYAVEDWKAPKDLYGRSQLFEPTGIALAGDGTVVIATRTAGIWRIRNRKWSLFAEGTYECLGVVIEDGKGDRIVVAQKPELTRIIDTDADGRADRFETVCDDYGFHGNYHEYCHGPARDKDGNYYFSLNLSHGGSERVSWRAGGPYMGSMGGYRGWACRVTPAGKFEPFANGLRSPAGIGVDPAGRLWYAENQGEYVGSSKVVPLEKGKFYGHLSGLITLPGMKPDSAELKFENWKDKIRKGAVWLPHGKMANSPGHPAWDTTDGKFGPYAGQMFIGDQTLSILLRVVTEQVRGADQGCVIPFARGLSSGVMRPCFLLDGSLLLGQTGRGWGARGGAQAALQRIHWDGKAIAAELHRISAAGEGLVVHFTRPLSPTVTDDELAGRLKVGSWFYTNTSRYGSPEHDRRTNAIAAVKIRGDRKSALLEFEGFGDGDKWLDRLYHVQIPDTRQLFGEAPARQRLEGYFTLRAIP